MAPKFWASDIQLEWLKSHVTEFCQARQNKKLHIFWNKISLLWFEQWPTSEAADSKEITNQKQVRRIDQMTINTCVG